jgi:outer membrane protein OmpA-like peptidoglycan-associated protein
MKPSGSYRTLTLEAYYKTPVLFPYNGNLLVDNASSIKKVTCPQNLAQSEEADPATDSSRKKRKASTQSLQNATTRKEAQSNQLNKKEYIQPSIMPELQIDKVSKNQTIQVRSLHFEADSINFSTESQQVLDEIYRFLDYYPNVKIEIGGHANLKPKKEYALNLSQKRAESVRNYLIEKGIEEDRVVPVGYGNTKPIVESVNRIANKLNQRVEIKILEKY